MITESKNGVVTAKLTPAMIKMFIALQMEFALPFNIKVLNKREVVDKPISNKTKLIFVEIETEVEEVKFLLDILEVIELAINLRT